MIEFEQKGDQLLVIFVSGAGRILLGNIDRNGFSPADNTRLVPETVKTIAIKAKEVREYGPNPEHCSGCNGTPYFPLNNCSSPRHLEFY